MALSVDNFTDYLRVRSSISKPSMVLSTLDETDESFAWKGEDFPWNGKTCLVVLNYVMKFLPNSDHHHHHGTTLTDTMKSLDGLAFKRKLVVWSRPRTGAILNMAPKMIEKHDRNLEMIEREIGEVYVNSFIPEVQRFFRVPKLHQLSDKDKSLKENEILAAFLDFLLRILDAEALVDSDNEQRLAPLQKELRFVLTFLGDIPFQCTQLELVKTILAEFEILSNETGTFIYNCFFATLPIKAVRFYEGRDSLLGLFGLLNGKIKEHCSKFSKIPRDIILHVNAIDSLFIVDSLLEDLENVINRRFKLPIDGIKDEIRKIHEEMMFARTFLKDVEVVHDTYDDELKESSFQIRNVAYETEYLVNSYLVGNVPIWYLNLRLPFVIQNIKLIRIRLQELKKVFDMKVLQVKKDFNQKLSSLAIKTSVDVAVNDNVVVGFEDEKLKILDALTAG